MIVITKSGERTTIALELSPENRAIAALGALLLATSAALALLTWAQAVNLDNWEKAEKLYAQLEK